MGGNIDDLELALVQRSAREFLNRGDRSLTDLAAMDWTGLLVDERWGGTGWRPAEACVVAEELGRARNGSTWFGNTMAAAALNSAPDGLREHWLPAMVAGTATAGFARAEDAVPVTGGEFAELLVTAGPNGVHLIELSGAQRRWPDNDLVDVARPAWRIDISDAPSVTIGTVAHADVLLAAARLLISADSVGTVASSLERLTAYLKERTAFDAPIASFQAVQHRLVELLVFVVKARAVIMKAARALICGDCTANPDALALSAAAHAFVATNATAAVDECLQLSGGIGFTWEYPLHHEMRRVFTNARLCGTARDSRAHFAAVSGW